MYQVAIRILEAHIDLLGHMNNATYLTLFEQARWEMITSRGYGVKEVQVRQQAPVILDVQLKFLKEVRLRETVQVTCELLSYEGKVGRLKQSMLKEDGAVAAEAEFTFGFFDLRTRRLIEPTPEWRKAVGLDTIT